ncbi:MAG TPA: hypothetical protein VGL77_05245, partial [Armatimonadota bacterium]
MVVAQGKNIGDGRAMTLCPSVVAPSQHTVLSTVWKPTAVALSLATVPTRKCLARDAERDSGLRPSIGFQTVLL